jgi:DNA-binding SARP family transcriptional activator/tetratricopeptide (TPR) repeat protein
LTIAWRLHVGSVPHLLSVAEAPTRVELSRKDAAWLAYVALGGVVPAARVAALLWPAPDSRRSLNSLRQRLHRLRRATGARLLEVGETAALAADLSLVEPLESVAIEADGEAAGGPLPGLLGAFDYGELTDFSTWLEVERAAWSARLCEALAEAASQAEAKHEIARALVYAKRLLVDEPLSEHAHRRVMRLHYLRGDVALAVAAFEACEQVLKDELGLKPSTETLEMLRLVELGAGTGADRTRGLTVPVGLLRPPRTVGRAAEKARLAQAAHGGSIVLLVGEAGMGKTRLLQDAVAAQSSAVYAQARPGDAAVPYGALARLLRAVVAAFPAALAQAPRHELARVAPEFGDGAPTTGQAARLQGAVERLLASVARSEAASGDAGEAAARFVLDDMHFADRASIEMLRALVDAESLADASWVFAHRPVGMGDEDGALLQSLADSPRASWIALPALAEPALAELIDSLVLEGASGTDLAGALWRHTGGNPLYALETLRAARGVPAGASGVLRLPRPHNIAHMIDRRLQRLSERAMALGRVAALAGPDFSAELAEHALATPALALAGAWAELEAADVLRGNAFAHDLVHDAMLRATPQAIAVHAHRLIAQYLAARNAEPARLAPHWLAGGEPGRAAISFAEAARHARRCGRPREQVRLLLQAAEAHDLAGSDEQAVDARTQALQPMFLSDGLHSASALCAELQAEHQRGPLAAIVWTRSASLLMNAGQAAQAEEAAKRALSLIDSKQEALHVEAVAALALAYRARGEGATGLEMLRPWVSRIESVADTQLQIEFRSAHALLLYHLDRLDEAADALHVQIALVRQEGEQTEQVATLLSLAALQLRRGDVAEVQSLAEEAAARQIDYDKPGPVPAYTRFLLGSALCAQGRYGEGLGLLESAVAMLNPASKGTLVHANCEAALAETLLQLGQPARAQQWVSEEYTGLSPGGRARRLLARTALERRLHHRASTELLRTLTETGLAAGGYWHMLARVEAAHHLPPADCAHACMQVLTEARRNGDHAVAVLASTARLNALCETAPADDLSAVAGDLEQQLGSIRSTLFNPAEVLLVCMKAHLRARQVEAATRCRQAGIAWLHDRALPHVPEAFVDAYLNRNSVALALAAAGPERA